MLRKDFEEDARRRMEEGDCSGDEWVRDIVFLVRVPKSKTYRKTQDIQSVFNCLSVTSLRVPLSSDLSFLGYL